MLNRRFGVGVLALAPLVAALAGCGMSGTAIPMVSDQPLASYRAQLSAGDQQELSARDQERLLDPCGFADATALASLGKPVSIGPAQNFEVCSIDYPRGTYTVDVTLGQWDESPIRTIDLGDIKLGVTPSGTNTCSITVPYLPHSFNYAVTSHNNTNACDAAITFARAALPLPKTPPLRMNSRVSLNTPLTRLDPCAVLSVIGKDRPRLQVITNTTPYNCDFYLDSNHDATRQELTENQKPLSVLAGERRLGKVTDINGVPGAVTDSGSAGGCRIDLFLDQSHPISRGNDQWVDEVEMSGHGSCDSLKRTAAALVDVYKNIR
ncbi:DUF3558 domain-containing protein [Nocardia sp. NEAU-G5]|uniref:DUF3558 domain-containing protein n=1 Tax=Nocardia albiluteola TaxID=2842303 RepID=A0ABS6BCG7_9NOCA|nr:DUF3558 domain-containing protein [Nocardia albiluteola]MBU3067982.1 DUF3558 domain-containing protein [Nocardia albiluteola]